MTSDDFKNRTKQFALRVIKLVDSLPKNSRSANHIGGQLLRSATSVAANYRAACRGRSPAEFQAKLGIVEEESDESAFWLEMLADGEMVKLILIAALKKEAEEITAMTVASIKTSKRANQLSNRSQNRPPP
jgi:four helix bundle protein